MGTGASFAAGRSERPQANNIQEEPKCLKKPTGASWSCSRSQESITRSRSNRCTEIIRTHR